MKYKGLHKCNILCHTMSTSEMEVLGVKEDPGLWLPFILDLGIVVAIKMASDTKGDERYNCSTVYCSNDQTFVLDTPYSEMVKRWESFMNNMMEEEDGDGKELSL